MAIRYNGYLYRIVNTKVASGSYHCTIQRRLITDSSWTVFNTIQTSGYYGGYYLTYNEQDQLGVVTRVVDYRAMVEQSQTGTVRLEIITGSMDVLLNLNYSNVGSAWSTAFEEYFDGGSTVNGIPSVWRSNNRYFLSFQIDYFNGWSTTIRNVYRFRNVGDGWSQLSSNYTVAENPVFFNNYHFCVGGFNHFTGYSPVRYNFYENESSPSYQIFNSNSKPYSTIRGNGKEKFFVQNGELVYIVTSQSSVGSTRTTFVQVYTSTDGNSFTLRTQKDISSLVTIYYGDVTYLGDNTTHWFFNADVQRQTGSNTTNNVFYSISKSDYSIQNTGLVSNNGSIVGWGFVDPNGNTGVI